jgi:ATP-dependent Lon protease
MEFYDVNFSYINNETMIEEFVFVPEQRGGKIIPEGLGKPGHIYTIARGKSWMIGTFKIETEVVSGSGKFERTGLGTDREAKESNDTAFRYFKANSKNISGSNSTTLKDYLMHIQDIHGIGLTSELSLFAFIALCSGAMQKPVQSQLAVLGALFSISGTINKVEELANVLQVCFDSGAKKVLLPMASAVDIGTVPPELFAKFQISFYQSPEDAVFKALGGRIELENEDKFRLSIQNKVCSMEYIITIWIHKEFLS